MAYEPTFLGYQILGDSQLLRFSKRYSTSRWKSNKDISSGLCVSGQKIEDLLRRLRENEHKISEKVILMIGTNDILQKSNFKRMKFFLDRILLQLLKDGASHIILMTIPPIPKYDPYDERCHTLRLYNEYIKTRHNGVDIFVIDAFAKFIEDAPERIELKPFGLSQNVNRIDETAIVPSTHQECNGKHHDSLHEDVSSFPPVNNSHECKTLRERRLIYNPLSDYTCDTDFSGNMKSYYINLHYFEKIFARSMKEDLIHLNDYGLEQIKELIVKEEYIKS